MENIIVALIILVSIIGLLIKIKCFINKYNERKKNMPRLF